MNSARFFNNILAKLNYPSTSAAEARNSETGTSLTSYLWKFSLDLISLRSFPLNTVSRGWIAPKQRFSIKRNLSADGGTINWVSSWMTFRAWSPSKSSFVTSVFCCQTLRNYLVWKRNSYGTQGKNISLTLKTNNGCKCVNAIESDCGKSQQKRETDKKEKLNKLWKMRNDAKSIQWPKY